MLLIPVKTPLVEEGDHLTDLILGSIEEIGVYLEDGDIIAIADKIVAVKEGRVKRLGHMKPSKMAYELSRRYRLNPSFVELIIQEADEIYGGTYRVLLTVKDGVIIANAGADRKNVPVGFVALWPSDPGETAELIRREIAERVGRRVGVILVDSRVNPLRMGTTGFALGIAGFKPVKDLRGEKDLYGKTLLVTRMNIADDLAAAAHLLMGETDGRIPLVVIRNAPIDIVEAHDPEEVKIPIDECLYMGTLNFTDVRSSHRV